MKHPEIPPVFLIFSVIILNIPAVCTGISIAWTSYLIEILKSSKTPLKEPITTLQTGYIASMLPIGAIYGAIVSALIIDKVGRKRSLALLSAHAFLGYLMMSIDTRMWVICVSRLLSGSLWGASFVIIPNYVAEISSKYNRGMLCALTTIAIATGKFFVFTLAHKLSIFSMSLSLMIFILIFFLFALPVVPPSPYYLVAKGKEKFARKTLKKFRHKPSSDIDEDFEELRDFVKTSFAEEHGIISFIKSTFLMRRLGRVSGIIAIQQLSGFNVIMLYMSSIFQSSVEAFPVPLSADIVAVVQLITPFLAPCLVDAYGRRNLLLASTIFSFLSLTVLGTALVLITQGKLAIGLSWIPIVGLILFIASYNLGLGPMVFVLLGEFFPPNAKAAGCSSSIVLSNFFILMITFAFPQATSSLGIGTTFLMFGFWCLVGAVYVNNCIPESKRMSLNEINDTL